MLLCYITDRTQFPGAENERRRRLLATIAEAACAGIDFIQLREKDLSSHDLELLGRQAVAAVRVNSQHTRILMNSRIDVALAVGADGVHLKSDDLYASEARAIWAASLNIQSSRMQSGKAQAAPIVSVSCHTAAEVQLAAAHGATFALFAPVFEKAGQTGAGLQALSAACRPLASPGKTEGPGMPQMPVLALGGVTAENVSTCLKAGAAGIAAIRLFQQGDLAETVASLRDPELAGY